MMQYRIVIPERARRGQTVQIRIAILHPMETGFRVDDLGRKIPRNVIHHLSCRYNGVEVFTAELGSGIAATPTLSCQAVAVDSGTEALTLVLRAAPLLRTPPAAGAFALARPLLSTRRPRARLRDVRYRGVVSAAMVYDDLAVIDAFRAVDDDTVLGAMDARGMAQPYLFQLHRA
jgi:hypothetical protein